MIKTTIFKQFFIILIILSLSGCSKRKKARVVKKIDLTLNQRKDLNNNQAEEVNLTIWVHGTCLLPRIFFSRFFNSDPGLVKYENINPTYYLKIISESISGGNLEKYPLEHFYIFGWSGGLNCKERFEASQNLYLSLIELINFYKSKNLTPIINIITHSHGGNVVLNLAKINNNKKIFEVEKLILLACPVQDGTKELIKNSLFKKVFSFYSTLDFLQILDPQGFHKNNENKKHKKSPLFSQRRFEKNENLKQIQIKINGRGILHSEFLSRHFLRALAKIIEELENLNTHYQDFLLDVHLN